MTNNQEFHPDWVSSPGDTITDILKERNVSVVEFAQRMGDTPESATDLIEGRASITIALARRLEKVLGSSVEFWMSRDFQYRTNIAYRYVNEKEWLAELPLGNMINFGWIKPAPHPSEEVASCLQFFNMPSVRAWYTAYAKVREVVAFRTSPSFDSKPAAVATWLRRGEILSETMECRPWNSKQFQSSLSDIRSLTRKKDPNLFIPELQAQCAENGVAVVVERALTGCRASGATRFLTKDKALLLLSFRYLTDDHFWFTFFHEAGHLLLHSRENLFIEGADTLTTIEEKEANNFAAHILIPPELVPDLLALPAKVREIIRFAIRLGVSPGIIVGQLQHYDKIGHDRFNRLKRRFRWED